MMFALLINTAYHTEIFPFRRFLAAAEQQQG
jgi:hypothetical protein